MCRNTILYQRRAGMMTSIREVASWLVKAVMSPNVLFIRGDLESCHVPVHTLLDSSAGPRSPIMRAWGWAPDRLLQPCVERIFSPAKSTSQMMLACCSTLFQSIRTTTSLWRKLRTRIESSLSQGLRLRSLISCRCLQHRLSVCARTLA